MKPEFKHTIIQNRYAKLLSALSKTVEVDDELSSALKSYVDNIKWVDSGKFITGFKQFLKDNRYERLDERWRRYLDTLKRNLTSIDNYKFDSELTTAIMAEIVSDPIVAHFTTVQFVGTGDVADKKYYYMNVTDKEDDSVPSELTLGGSIPCRQVSMETYPIASSATFDKCSIRSMIPADVKFQISDLHGEDIVSLSREALTFEMHQEVVRKLMQYMRNASTKSSIDVSAYMTNLTKDTADETFDHIFDTYITGNHVLVSPDVAALIACTSRVQYTMHGSYQNNMPCSKYIHKRGDIYIYRDIYAMDSYMLGVNKEYTEGLIFHPGIGYSESDDNGDEREVRLGITMTDDNDNTENRGIFPFAIVDKSQETTYQFVEMKNISAAVGIPAAPKGPVSPDATGWTISE